MSQGGGQSPPWYGAPADSPQRLPPPKPTPTRDGRSLAPGQFPVVPSQAVPSRRPNSLSTSNSLTVPGSRSSPSVGDGTPDTHHPLETNSGIGRSASSLSIRALAQASATTPIKYSASDKRASHFEHKVYKDEADIPFRHIRILGRGTFGIVECVECTDGPLRGSTFASKIIVSRQLDSPKFAERIRSEADIIRKLRHQHLVTVQLTYRWKHQFCMIMEPVADMDLEAFLQNLDEMAPEKRSDESLVLLTRWHGCLIDVLAYLYTQKISHKDIKPSNILVKGQNVLLTDFGVARDLVEETTTANFGRAGTPMYSAPEVVSLDRYGRSADVFSMGAIFLELNTVLNGKTIAEFKEFRGPPGKQSYATNTDSVLKWIISLGRGNTRASARPKLRPDTHALLWLCSRMLQPKPEKRIGVTELRQIVAGISSNSGILRLDVSCSTCSTKSDQEYPDVNCKMLATNFVNSLDKLSHIVEPLDEKCLVTWKDADAAGFSSVLLESPEAQAIPEQQKPTLTSNEVPTVQPIPIRSVTGFLESAEEHGYYYDLCSELGHFRTFIEFGPNSWMSKPEGRAGLADLVIKLVQYTGKVVEIFFTDKSLTEVKSILQGLASERPEFHKSGIWLSESRVESEPMNIIILDDPSKAFLEKVSKRNYATARILCGARTYKTGSLRVIDIVSQYGVGNDVEKAEKAYTGNKNTGIITVAELRDGNYYPSTIMYSCYTFVPQIDPALGTRQDTALLQNKVGAGPLGPSPPVTFSEMANAHKVSESTSSVENVQSDSNDNHPAALTSSSNPFDAGAESIAKKDSAFEQRDSSAPHKVFTSKASVIIELGIPMSMTKEELLQIMADMKLPQPQSLEHVVSSGALLARLTYLKSEEAYTAASRLDFFEVRGSLLRVVSMSAVPESLLGRTTAGLQASEKQAIADEIYGRLLSQPDSPTRPNDISHVKQSSNSAKPRPYLHTELINGPGEQDRSSKKESAPSQPGFVQPVIHQPELENTSSRKTNTELKAQAKTGKEHKEVPTQSSMPIIKPQTDGDDEVSRSDSLLYSYHFYTNQPWSLVINMRIRLALEDEEAIIRALTNDSSVCQVLTGRGPKSSQIDYCTSKYKVEYTGLTKKPPTWASRFLHKVAS